MSVLTEAALRILLKDEDLDALKEYRVEADVIVTPSARSYLTDHRINLVIGGKRVIKNPSGGEPVRAQQTNETGGKPEYMTALGTGELVYKDHLTIKLRGRVDSFQAETLKTLIALRNAGYAELARCLSEVLDYARAVMRAEVIGGELPPMKLFGMDEDHIHDASHHPMKHFGVPHFMPITEGDGEAVLALNALRTAAREVEIAAYEAFKTESGAPGREDIVKGLNRLSSAIYVLMLKAKAAEAKVGPRGARIILEASGRHIHVSKADLEALFGPGHKLTKRGDLSQPGQFSCVERVRLIGPGGEFPSVIILGPERPQTQAEISLTDAKALGIDAPLRLSGDTAGTPGVKIAGPAGEVDIPQGVIVAKRHVHMSADDAASYGLSDGQTVSVRCGGERGVTFHEVPLRVSPDFATRMHIDYDEANALGFQSGMTGFLELN